MHDKIASCEITLCEAFGLWIDFIADNSPDYASFRVSLSQDAQEARNILKAGQNAARPPKPNGFNDLVEANGADNFLHFAGVLEWGALGGAVQTTIDAAEYITDNSEQNLAEIASDMISQGASMGIHIALAREGGLFGPINDDAWTRVRRQPGKEWRSGFCDDASNY